jgi:hypothetical protein
VSGGLRYDGPSAESNRNIGLPRFPGSLLIEDGLLTAPQLYLIGFPVPSGTTGPNVLPSGYDPQCDPG